MKTLLHAFTIGQNHYCNSVFVAISAQLLQKLEAIEYAAEHLITGAIRHQSCVNSTGHQHDMIR